MLKNWLSSQHKMMKSCPVRFASLLLLLLVFASTPSFAQQNAGNYEVERQRAVELINQGKTTEALPIFEKLSTQNQTDAQVAYGLGLSTFMSSKEISDRNQRKQMRLRARESLLRAKELGVNDPTLEKVLFLILPNGGERGVSEIKEANEALEEGFSAFKAGEFARAAKGYGRAARLDPQFYEAALYTGDCYYRLKEWDKAGEWFAKAIAIDPERETAYRYWADALMFAGKQTEARAKFIDAIIAEPYSQLSWKGLVQWAQRNNVQIAQPQIQIPDRIRTWSDDQKAVNDPLATAEQNDGSGNWAKYVITRTAWRQSEFAKAFPQEKSYRHSLVEEVTALKLVAEGAKAEVSAGKVKALAPALATLVKLSDAGLLEAYVLLGRSDLGIARDYDTYRKTNREKLRQYITEYVIGNGQSQHL